METASLKSLKTVRVIRQNYDVNAISDDFDMYMELLKSAFYK